MILCRKCHGDSNCTQRRNHAHAACVTGKRCCHCGVTTRKGIDCPNVRPQHTLPVIDIEEGDIITIDGWYQAPYKGARPSPLLMKPLPMKMINGALRMMLHDGHAPVMAYTKNQKWRFTGNGYELVAR